MNCRGTTRRTTTHTILNLSSSQEAAYAPTFVVPMIDQDESRSRGRSITFPFEVRMEDERPRHSRTMMVRGPALLSCNDWATSRTNQGRSMNTKRNHQSSSKQHLLEILDAVFDVLETKESDGEEGRCLFALGSDKRTGTTAAAEACSTSGGLFPGDPPARRQ